MLSIHQPLGQRADTGSKWITGSPTPVLSPEPEGWEKDLAKARPVPGKLGRLITLDLEEQREGDLGSQFDLSQCLHFLSHNSVFVLSVHHPKQFVCACALAGLYSHGGHR